MSFFLHYMDKTYCLIDAALQYKKVMFKNIGSRAPPPLLHPVAIHIRMPLSKQMLITCTCRHTKQLTIYVTQCLMYQIGNLVGSFHIMYGYVAQIRTEQFRLVSFDMTAVISRGLYRYSNTLMHIDRRGSAICVSYHPLCIMIWQGLTFIEFLKVALSLQNG